MDTKRTTACLLFSTLCLLAAPCLAAGTAQFDITSPAFANHGSIPSQYTCDGQGISPKLQWSHVPQGTRSLALIVTDPDAPDPSAPKTTWVHWVVYDLPANTNSLSEAIQPQAMPATSRDGLNSWHKTGYGAPCPPTGRHRYFFTLYALDTTLPDLRQPDKNKLKKAMAGHILQKTAIIGTYKRSQ